MTIKELKKFSSRVDFTKVTGKAKISPGNSKTGAIPSISILAEFSCNKNCECYKNGGCYMDKMLGFRKNVAQAYLNNTLALFGNPAQYWGTIEDQAWNSRFFRYHIYGDIVNLDYLIHQIEIAKKYPNTNFLCFTKKYDIINKYVETFGDIPSNLKIIFSAWRNFPMNNPFNFPVCHLIYKDGSTTLNGKCNNVYNCSGNCSACAKANKGCWALDKGDVVLIKQH